MITAAGFGFALTRLSPAMLGTQLFASLMWTAFLGALGAGLFFTSDSISEEKREGTMGLLFLTDLRGYDIVTGKFLASALRGVYGLLAAVPIIGISLTMGGVTGLVFFKSSLALLNALFASLVAGLFVSAISRDSQKALLATVLVLAFWLGAGPIVDSLMQPMQPFFSFSSPAYLVKKAMRGASGFWPGLIVNQALTLALLALACHFAANTWRDKTAAPANALEAMDRWLKFGGQTRRQKFRRKLVRMNPVCWLACRQRWQAAVLWAIAALLIAGAAAVVYINNRSAWNLTLFGDGAVRFLLYIAVASHAGRFLADARRNGLLELFLVTPLTGGEIIAGQWQALLRMFGWPLGIILATQLATHFLFFSFHSSASAPVHTVLDILLIPAHLAALIWFGMWMGLVSKNINTAAWKALLFVQVLPWFVVTFSQFGLFRLAGPTWPGSLGQYAPLLLYLTKDFVFIAWSRRKLYAEFHGRVTNRAGATRLPSPVPLSTR